MLPFIKYKKEIRPLLANMVDIHNHILPGIDDGAKSVADSLEMLKIYEQLNVKKIIATPHVLEGSYHNTEETIRAAYSRIIDSGHFDKNECVLEIARPSAEYMLDENFSKLLAKGSLLPLKDNYILVEMSYFQPPHNLNEVLFSMQHKGYVPILAHPERYNFIDSESKFQQLKKSGCLFQLNLLSLSTHYGPHVQKKAFKLLKGKMYDFVGTDAHHSKHLKKIKDLKVDHKYISLLQGVITNTEIIFGNNH